MKKLLVPYNWIKKFLQVRKLNKLFHGKNINNFVIIKISENSLSNVIWLKDYLAVYFIFDDYSSLSVVIKDDKNDSEYYYKFITSVIKAWPDYKILGFGILDYIFKDTLSFLEKRCGRKILKLNYVLQPKIFHHL